MTKKLVGKLVKNIKYDLDGKSLAEVIIVLETLVKDHGKEATIDIEEEADYGGSIYSVVNLYTKCLETDEEYNKRRKTEKSIVEAQKQRELKQLQFLTNKYGK